jgi:hypothetical protein
MKSGEPVAVKIQYPGIARTIDANFRNLFALVLPLRLGKAWESQKAQFEEIRRSSVRRSIISRRPDPNASPANSPGPKTRRQRPRSQASGHSCTVR